MRKNLNNIPFAKDLGSLALRLTFGLAMLFGHGWGKALKLFGDEPIKFADVLGMGETLSLALAVFSEVVCSALIALGLFTRWAIIPSLITMLVALFIIHGDDPFAKQEKALLYGTAYLAIFLIGPGRISLDNLIRKK
jgi:putative oxidoreductase